MGYSIQFSSVAQSCLTLCNPIDCTPPVSSVHGILEARILEWVAMPSSRGLPNPGIKPRSPTLQADLLPSEPPGKAPFHVFSPLYFIHSINSVGLPWQLSW